MKTYILNIDPDDFFAYNLAHRLATPAVLPNGNYGILINGDTIVAARPADQRLIEKQNEVDALVARILVEREATLRHQRTTRESDRVYGDKRAAEVTQLQRALQRQGRKITRLQQKLGDHKEMLEESIDENLELRDKVYALETRLAPEERPDV